MKFWKFFSLFLVALFFQACAETYVSPLDKFYEVTSHVSVVTVKEDKLLKEFRIYFDGLDDGSLQDVDAKFLEFSLIEFRSSIDSVGNLMDEVDLFAGENSETIKNYYESEYLPLSEEYLAFIDQTYNRLLEGEVSSEEIEEMKSKFLIFTEDFYFVTTGLSSELVESYYNISILNLP